MMEKIGDYYETIIGGSEAGDTAYYFANNERVAENKSGVKRYYSGDHLGSTNLVTDSNGNLVEWSSYYPFGGVKDGGSWSTTTGV